MAVDEEAKAHAVAWQKYLEQLEKDDPAEFKALQADLEQFQKQLAEESASAVNSPLDASKLRQEQQQQAEAEETLAKIKLPGRENKVLAKDGVEREEEGVKVEPEPGFVLKTRDELLQKVFINLCQSPLIQKMGTKKQLDAQGNEQEGMHIPLSLGPGLPSKDKAGKDCIVYDIIVNPEVISNCSTDSSGASRAFLCNLAIEYVEQKYGCVLDRKYKLPKLKYKGNSNNIPYQLIRKRRAPVIEEVTKSQPSEVRPKKSVQKTKEQTVRYTLKLEDASQQEEVDCEPILSDPTLDASESKFATEGVIVFRASFDALPDGVEVIPQLELSPEYLVLRVSGYYKKLELFLPQPVAIGASSATLNRSTKEFIVRMPLEQDLSVRDAWKQSSQPDAGSRPWILANAIGRESPSRTTSKQHTQTTQRGEVEKDDALPEDRFHLNDLLSQHIKQERAQGREKREREYAEKERVREKEEAEKKLKEEALAKQKLLSEAQKRVTTTTAEDSEIDDSFVFKPKAEDLELF